MKNLQQTKTVAEKDKYLLLQCKSIIKSIDPDAEVILYGSRARGDAESESDYDLLIITNSDASMKKEDEIREELYPLQVETGSVLTLFLISRNDWESPLYKAMPFYQNVAHEGIVV